MMSEQQVPFVDVVTTMLDESIPLTTGEYDEWGDPRREEDFRRMLSYSPYDNVAAVAMNPRQRAFPRPDAVGCSPLLLQP